MRELRVTTLFVFILVLTASIEARARPWTLEQTIQAILQVNPQLQSLQDLVRAKEAAAKQAYAVPNPEIGGVASNRGAMLSVGQEFEYPGKRDVRVKQAEQELELAKVELKAKRIQLSARVATLFFEELWAKKNQELLQENLKDTDEFLQAAREKFDMGFGGKLDVLKGQVESLRAKRLLLAAENKRLKSQLQLQLLLGQAAGDSFDIEGNLEHQLFGSGGGLDSLLGRAYRVNPLLIMEHYKVKGAELAVKAADLSTKPNFNFNLSGGIDDDETRVELELRLPIALWDRKEGAKDEALYRSKSAGSDSSDIRLRITSKVTSAYQENVNAKKAARLFEDSILEEAKSAAQMARNAFETSSFRFLDLIDAQRTYLGAAMEYERTLRTLRLSEVELMQSVGMEFPGGTQ